MNMLVKADNNKVVKIIYAILDNLRDRSGIGNELEAIDDDIYGEMVADLITIVEDILND